MNRTRQTHENEAEADALVASFLNEAAAIEPPSLPSAGRLWWRAEILERLDAEQRRAARAARPVRWATALAMVAAVVAVVIGISTATDDPTGTTRGLAMGFGAMTLVGAALLTVVLRGPRRPQADQR